MEKRNWLALKSGTDVRGTAVEGIPGDPATLTDEAVKGILKAFCLRLSVPGGSRPVIAIGHDSRVTAARIERAAAEAAAESGCDVILTGLSSTPSMFMLLQERDIGADASVMITASHLPYQKNGLKFFLPSGGLGGNEIREVLSDAAEGKAAAGAARGTVRRMDYISRYSENLVRFVREKTGEMLPLSGRKIIVDAGNGAGGFYAEKVLKPLGADTEGSCCLEPDGLFPNHIPNPENRQAMESVCAQVKRCGADFGIIFDTDVDRAGAVDENGEEINRNRLIALISAILLEEKPGSVIVTDSVTSDGLTEFIERHGGIHFRYRRGYRNVIDKAKELCAAGRNAPLAIETSGHAALQENYFLDDGAYLVTRLLVTLAKLSKEGRSITSLIADLPEPAEAGEARLPFAPGADFRAVGKTVLETLPAFISETEGVSPVPENHEGVRMNFGPDRGDGWALVRMSLHEPILPVNLESNTPGGLKAIALTLLGFFRGFPELDTAPLEKFL